MSNKMEKTVILYVDDDKDMLDSLGIVLEANGYKVEKATSAEDGLKLCKKINPDLILADLMMEEVDAGIKFVKELKLIDHCVPVYLLSSLGDKLNAEIAYAELGLTGIFQKPVDHKVLLTTIKQKLG